MFLSGAGYNLMGMKNDEALSLSGDRTPGLHEKGRAVDGACLESEARALAFLKSHWDLQGNERSGADGRE